MKDRIVAVDIFREMTLVLKLILVTNQVLGARICSFFTLGIGMAIHRFEFPLHFFLFIVGTFGFCVSNPKTTANTIKKFTVRKFKLIGLDFSWEPPFTYVSFIFKEFSSIRFPGDFTAVGAFSLSHPILLLFRWKTLIQSPFLFFSRYC